MNEANHRLVMAKILKDGIDRRKNYRYKKVDSLCPCDCESIADLCSMNSTHKNVGKFGMMLQHDQAVILTEQSIGEKCRSQIVIPKRIFKQLLEWYETEQSNEQG